MQSQSLIAVEQSPLERWQPPSFFYKWWYRRGYQYTDFVELLIEIGSAGYSERGQPLPDLIHPLQPVWIDLPRKVLDDKELRKILHHAKRIYDGNALKGLPDRPLSVPDDLDPLKDDLNEALDLYEGWRREESDQEFQKRLQKIIRAAKQQLDDLFIDRNAPRREVLRWSGRLDVLRIELARFVNVPHEASEGRSIWQEEFELSPDEWLIGVRIALIFNKHFKERDGLNGGIGPFADFVQSFTTWLWPGNPINGASLAKIRTKVRKSKWRRHLDEMKHEVGEAAPRRPGKKRPRRPIT
jgi:hypothetical protein